MCWNLGLLSLRAFQLVITAGCFVKPRIYINKSFSSYFICSIAQILSLHMFSISFHRKECQSIGSFSQENTDASAGDLHSFLSGIILKIYCDKA